MELKDVERIYGGIGKLNALLSFCIHTERSIAPKSPVQEIKELLEKANIKDDHAKFLLELYLVDLEKNLRKMEATLKDMTSNDPPK